MQAQVARLRPQDLLPPSLFLPRTSKLVIDWPSQERTSSQDAPQKKKTQKQVSAKAAAPTKSQHSVDSWRVNPLAVLCRQKDVTGADHASPVAHTHRTTGVGSGKEKKSKGGEKADASEEQDEEADEEAESDISLDTDMGSEELNLDGRFYICCNLLDFLCTCVCYVCLLWFCVVRF